MSRVELNKFNPQVGYSRGASKRKEILWYLIKVCFFLSSIPYPSSLKSFMLRAFGAKIGKGVVIKPRVNIHMPWKLTVGNFCWIGEEVCILNFEPCRIGNNVCVSQRAFLCGGNHDYRDPSMRYRNGTIELEDGCWIGAGSFIAPNTVVGVDTVVAACSFVNHPLDRNKIYSGNPIREVGQRWK